MAFSFPAARVTAMPFEENKTLFGHDPEERIVAVARPREMHFAALEPVESAMRFRRAHVFMGGELRPPEYDRLDTSQVLIRSVMAKGSN